MIVSGVSNLEGYLVTRDQRFTLGDGRGMGGGWEGGGRGMGGVMNVRLCRCHVTLLTDIYMTHHANFFLAFFCPGFFLSTILGSLTSSPAFSSVLPWLPGNASSARLIPSRIAPA